MSDTRIFGCSLHEKYVVSSCGFAAQAGANGAYGTHLQRRCAEKRGGSYANLVFVTASQLLRVDLELSGDRMRQN
eukprot:3618078-Rhodomonas_salina.13